MARKDEKERLHEQFRERVYGHLVYLRQNDPGFTIERLEGNLDSLYTYEGHDWVGRGEFVNTRIAAEIAAHEQLLAEWRAELGGRDAEEGTGS